MFRRDLIALMVCGMAAAAAAPACAASDGSGIRPPMRECFACHTKVSETEVGPPFSGISGRTSETVIGFRFCDGRIIADMVEITPAQHSRMMNFLGTLARP
ncbi:hypothetical protein STVA_35010 [Allostella vacuolata]|nr:hypothetical protein STVA_35010 [Stella vacuolata]